jgi:ABC-type branched-subunit amino acid transport system ATPase component
LASEALSVRGVDTYYGDSHVLHGIGFTLQPGRLLGLLGRTIAQLKAEGLSIVLVEQNIKLTLDLADDVVIVNTGTVVFNGSAAETKANQAMIAQHLGVF